MNTRLNFTSPATHANRFSRAAFSPIRAARSGTSGIARTVQTDAPAFRVSPLNIPPFAIATEAQRPAWHRGPLDRLQPILTRYRD